MLFLFVPQESWDLQLRMFGYITCGFPRIFGYVLQVIKYSISVPLDRGGCGGWNIMLTMLTITNSILLVDLLFTVLSSIVTFLTSISCLSNYQSRAPRPLRKSCMWWLSLVDKDLTQSRVLFLHMVKMMGPGIAFRVYSFNPLFTVESKAHVPSSKKRANMFF